MKICFFSVFYNTEFLFKPLIGSIRKNSGLNDYDVLIYDNSTDLHKRIDPSNSSDNIRIKYIGQETYKGIHLSNGSAIHTKTIDLGLHDIMNEYDYCILLDSDVLVIREIKSIIDIMDKYDFTLAGYHDVTNNRNLIHPCSMCINLKKINENKISFFDENRMWHLKNTGSTYDTGMSFYEDVIKKHLRVFELPYNYFAHHFGAGSRDYKTAGKVFDGKKIYRDISEWLNDFSWTYA